MDSIEEILAEMKEANKLCVQHYREVNIVRLRSTVEHYRVLLDKLRGYGLEPYNKPLAYLLALRYVAEPESREENDEA